MNYLDSLSMLFASMIDVYIMYDFFDAYFERKSDWEKRFRRIIAFLIVSFCIFLVNTWGNSYLNLIFYLVLNWIFISTVFQTETGTRLIFFFIAVIVAVGCEFLFGIMLSIPWNTNQKNSVVNLSKIPWHIFTMKLLNFILLSIIKQFFGNCPKTIHKKKFLSYLCIPIACLGIMILTYYSGIGDGNTFYFKAMLCGIFALILLGNIAVFNVFNRYLAGLYENAEQKIIISHQSMELKYYRQVEKMDKRYQEFMHDMRHYLKTIGELAQANENQHIVSILQDMHIELERNVMEKYTDHTVLNIILSEKQALAQQYGGKLDIYIEPEIVLMHISDVDMVGMLSNLLENALQAIRDTEDKSIHVRIYSENEGSFIIFKIVNRYCGELKNTPSGFASTKKEEGHHGIGLKSVQHMAEKYGGYLECIAEEDYFIAVLLLPVTDDAKTAF